MAHEGDFLWLCTDILHSSKAPLSLTLLDSGNESHAADDRVGESLALNRGMKCFLELEEDDSKGSFVAESG